MKDNKINPFEIDFDSYIRQSEPEKQENGKLWQTAIGLQQVDGLNPSKYLYETANADMIRQTLEYDFGQEKAFDYSTLSKEEAVKHLTRFIANIWQIHPFGDAPAPKAQTSIISTHANDAERRMVIPARLLFSQLNI